MQCSFFFQGKLNSFKYFSPLYPNDIHILFIHFILLSKEVLLIPKITLQNAKNASHFLKKTFLCGGLKDLLHSAYLLWSLIQTIIHWTWAHHQYFQMAKCVNLSNMFVEKCTWLPELKLYLWNVFGTACPLEKCRLPVLQSNRIPLASLYLTQQHPVNNSMCVVVGELNNGNSGKHVSSLMQLLRWVTLWYWWMLRQFIGL